jgi:peptide/nickel transport system ATP-binding protein
VPLLAISNLSLSVPSGTGLRSILRDVSLSIETGEAVGLVGESGAGKSMATRAISRILPKGTEVSGKILFDSQSVLDMDNSALRLYRRKDISLIPQDPKVAINPVHSVGDFLIEALHANEKVSAHDARQRAIDGLADVGINDGERRLRQYPHELSGGMLQRVMITAALLAGSRLLLADEPTTALDVTTQSEVMAILDELRRSRGLSLLFISHDLELAAAVCERICVMYAGEIVESKPARSLERSPTHPYTRALFEARPSVTSMAVRLHAIPGRPTSAFEVGDECGFRDRCRYAEAACGESRPELTHVEDGLVRCRRVDELPRLTSLDAGLLDD